MEDQILPIDKIYVPVKRRATLNEETVKILALEILKKVRKCLYKFEGMEVALF